MSTATDRGPLNAAAAPSPSSHEAVADPASVVTTPERVTIRISAPSAIITLSFASISIPLRPLKVADVPIPLTKLPTPFPASVETDPVGVTMRIRLLPESETARSPLEKTAMPRGFLKDDARPAPSAKVPVPDPASVETMRKGEINRIR